PPIISVFSSTRGGHTSPPLLLFDRSLPGRARLREFSDRLALGFLQRVPVAFRRPDVAVTQHFGNNYHVDAGVGHARGRGVSEVLKPEVFDLRRLACLPVKTLPL